MDKYTIIEVFKKLDFIDQKNLTKALPEYGNLFEYIYQLDASSDTANNMTDSDLILFRNLHYLKCNRYFTDVSLGQLTRLISLNCGWNTNFTDASLCKLTQLIKLYYGVGHKFTNLCLSKIKYTHIY